MKVTVCQLHDDDVDFERDWSRLAEHVRRERSQLVLLSEMAFAPWFARTSHFDADAWRRAVQLHERWLGRIGELAPAAVLATRPLDRDGRRFNEAFVSDSDTGYRAAHVKAFLPHEIGFHESDWYHAGDAEFAPIKVRGASVGFQICTEMWSMGHAHRYGKLGAQVIAVPRATSRSSGEKWLTGGRVAAIVSGAYALSSCRVSTSLDADLGGFGWIVSPDGDVLATTSDAEPFQTREIDLSVSDTSKQTYPRYALSD
jgi:N-carbamoylputrescine amidase